MSNILNELIAFRNNILATTRSSHPLSNEDVAAKLTKIINEMKMVEASSEKRDIYTYEEHLDETGGDCVLTEYIEYILEVRPFTMRDLEAWYDSECYSEPDYSAESQECPVTWWLTFPDQWQLPFDTKNEAMLFKTVLELSLERSDHPVMSKANIYLIYAGYTTSTHFNYADEHLPSNDKRIYTTSDIFASFVNRNNDEKATSETSTYHAEPKHDPVHHPKHYELMPGVEVKDILRALGNKPSELTGWQEFCRGNVLKYVLRAEEKNGQQDYEKAAVYLGWLLKNYEEC